MLGLLLRIIMRIASLRVRHLFAIITLSWNPACFVGLPAHSSVDDSGGDGFDWTDWTDGTVASTSESGTSSWETPAGSGTQAPTSEASEGTSSSAEATYTDPRPPRSTTGESTSSEEESTASPSSGEGATTTGDPLLVGLADNFSPYFPVGTAVEPSYLDSHHEILMLDFNRLTAENVMKPSNLHPSEGSWNWGPADQIAAFAQENGWKMTGHTLLWHTSQGAPWMTDSRDQEFADNALCDHITTVITHFATQYPGVIDNWDVVNEAIADGGGYRLDSPWHQTYGGREYILRAFQCAEAAVNQTGQDIALYYNDFNVLSDSKRATIVETVQWLQSEGVRIDGVGLQGHWHINYPSRSHLELAINDLLDLGIDIKISELDVSIYDDFSGSGSEPELSPLPPDRESAQAARYFELFYTLRNYSDAITSVTLWGISDDHSWLDSHGQVPGRNDHPLLYDDDHQPKQAYRSVMGL